MSTRDSRYSVGWNILYPPLVSPYASPQGKKTINQNGSNIDVAEYVTADVNVQPNLGTKSITTNGTYNASSDNLDGYSQVVVETPVPSGTLNVTANGDYDVTNYVQASVSVPGSPSGKITITENGTDVNIAQYATADIIVPQGITPTGNIDIIADQYEKTVDVTNYASAKVYNPVSFISVFGYIENEADTSTLELPYDPTRTLKEIIVLPVVVDMSKARNMMIATYRYTTASVEIFRSHTYTGDGENPSEVQLNGGYIPEPVIDAENHKITIAGRNASYKWLKDSVYFYMVVYEVPFQQEEEGGNG